MKTRQAVLVGAPYAAIAMTLFTMNAVLASIGDLDNEKPAQLKAGTKLCQMSPPFLTMKVLAKKTGPGGYLLRIRSKALMIEEDLDSLVYHHPTLKEFYIIEFKEGPYVSQVEDVVHCDKVDIITKRLQLEDQHLEDDKLPPEVQPLPKIATDPVSTLQASGVTQGHPYLALVQRRIAAQWTAPPVDLTGQLLQVVVKFRLDKSGRLSDIVIERTSRNEYYDLAARRAVLSANPLPSFPSDIPQLFLDAHFSFAIGEPPQK